METERGRESFSPLTVWGSVRWLGGEKDSRPRCSQWLHQATILVGVVVTAAGCWSSSDREVIVYTALDREFSEPILNEFQQRFEIEVRGKFDVESTKTVGLVNAIIGEQQRPRCDVFWNNEIIHTIRLQELGLLDAYAAPNAKFYPKNYVSPDGKWHGFAARARVFIVNTDRLPNREDWPTSIRDLADEKWQGQVAIAKPLWGTTATHAAVLFSSWGSNEAKQFFSQVKRNAAVCSGNKQVAMDVAAGKYAFGWTDTDDAIIEQDNGKPVAIVPPDQGEAQMGTLFIPNTLCIIQDCPNKQHAQKLVDFLLSGEVESRLAQGRSAQFPVGSQTQVKSRVQFAKPVRWMAVDFAAAAQHWDETFQFLTTEFQTAQ